QHLGVSYTRVNQLLVRADTRTNEVLLRELAPASARAQRLRDLEDRPPSHLIASIGRPPAPNARDGRAELRLEWRRLALAIEDFRDQGRITDQVRPLGA